MSTILPKQTHPSRSRLWDDEGLHPGMRVSASSSQQLKELSIERSIPIFTEYLTYDKDTPEQMKAFVAAYPWVLTEPLVCASVVTKPDCYHALKDMGWWDSSLAHMDLSVDRISLWLKNTHALALAYDATDLEVERIDWPSWELLVQEHGPYCPDINDSSAFFKTKALMLLANRIDSNLAPLMCAAMHIMVPMETLEKEVALEWTPLQKAQYAWVMLNTEHPQDIWPTNDNAKPALIQAQLALESYMPLASSQDITSMTIVHELCNSDMASTVYELIQLAQSKPSSETLDYTHALGDDANSGPAYV